MELKERISDLMAERGWSQKQLASESGVVFATINRLFNRDGYKPSLDTLEGIAKAFGMSVVELLQDESIAIDKQVKGYLEFQGEVAAIRSFTQLKKWYDDVAYNYTTLKDDVKEIKRLNKERETICKKEAHVYDFSNMDFQKVEKLDTSRFFCYPFKTGKDVRDGLSIPLGNQCSGFPFIFQGHEILTSEHLYLCGEFSENTDSHLNLQRSIMAEQNGFVIKRYIKTPNKKNVRTDWEKIRVQWMLYVMWQKCSNSDFKKLLLSIPIDAIIIEDSTTVGEETSSVWGLLNKEQSEARDKVERYVRFTHPSMRKDELETLVAKERGKIQYIGTYQGGLNCCGKCLKLCQLALIGGTEPPIDYHLLQNSGIYFMGDRLDFSDKL